MERREPTPDEIAQVASELGCTLRELEAVIAVEASGRWHDDDGRLVARFEPHHVSSDTQRVIGFSGNWRTALGLASSTRERMFQRAWSVDPEEAARATSWGAFQIMGFNHALCGYPSALRMCDDMRASPIHQLRAFAAFCREVGADAALRSHDWVRFAELYNGTGQPQVYARKIEDSYRRTPGTGAAVSMQLQRLGSSGQSVRELQRALASRDFEVEVDGRFGHETFRAVQDFQRSEELPVDGVVGARTWAALRDDVPYRPTPETDPGLVEELARRGANLLNTGGGVTGVLALVADRFDGLDPHVQIALVGAAVVLLGAGTFALLVRRRQAAGRSAAVAGWS